MQYSLFDTVEPDYDQILTDKAKALIEALNDGIKLKYEPQYTMQHGKYVVLIVANKKKDVLFNILDIYGNTPPEFSVCWRSAYHIKKELNLN